jgi:CheY-like chemotaxis protein
MNDDLREYRPAVLVADDSRLERAMLDHILSRDGFPIVMAVDGNEAMKLLADPASPRMVILDWVMPGPNGPEIVRWLRDQPHGRAAYVLLLTGKDSSSDIVTGLDAGADDFMTKPFRADELLARLRAGSRVLWLQQQLEDKVLRMEAAMAEVRRLRGLIPICMHCHRIRSEGEHWQGLEAYIEEHSDASFSHSLCEDCLQLHYPEDGDTPAAQPSVPPGPRRGGAR